MVKTSRYCQEISLFWHMHRHQSLMLQLSNEIKLNFNPLSANLTKWSNTFKQFVGNSRYCLSVFDHFVGLALKGLNWSLVVLSSIFPCSFSSPTLQSKDDLNHSSELTLFRLATIHLVHTQKFLKN